MQISPQRRQRALKAHQLRQQGRSLRNIAKQLGVSHSTICSDLKLLETHWSDVAQQSADDHLLEQSHLLQRRLRAVFQQDLSKDLGHLSPGDFIRAYHARNDEVAILLRETRRTISEIHKRADIRQLQPGEQRHQLDYPTDELAAAAKPSKPAVPNLPQPSKPNHSNQQIPPKTLQIPSPAAPEEISNQPLEQPIPEHILKEAQAFLERHRKDLFQGAAAAGG